MSQTTDEFTIACNAYVWKLLGEHLLRGAEAVPTNLQPRGGTLLLMEHLGKVATCCARLVYSEPTWSIARSPSECVITVPDVNMEARARLRLTDRSMGISESCLCAATY